MQYYILKVNFSQRYAFSSLYGVPYRLLWFLEILQIEKSKLVSENVFQAQRS